MGAGVGIVEDAEGAEPGGRRVSVRDRRGIFCAIFWRLAGRGGGDGRDEPLPAGRLPDSGGGSSTPSTSTTSASTSTETGVVFALDVEGDDEAEAFDVDAERYE